MTTIYEPKGRARRFGVLSIKQRKLLREASKKLRKEKMNGRWRKATPARKDRNVKPIAGPPMRDHGGSGLRCPVGQRKGEGK